MASRKNAGPGIFVATETFACEIDGERITVHKGETRVREGHPLLEAQGGYFAPVEDDVHYDIEQATAAPGEQRGGRRQSRPEDYSSLNQPELKAKLDERGVGYPSGPVANKVLVELLEADDAKKSGDG